MDNNPRTFAGTCDAKMPTRGQARGGEVGGRGDAFPSDELMLLTPIPLLVTLIPFMMPGVSAIIAINLLGERPAGFFESL
jgi:hypothetical protein